MKILTSLILLLSFLEVSAQKNRKGEISYYVFNANGEPCKIEEGKFIGILEKLADTAWQWKYYNFTGPIISVETYRDREMTLPHGYFAFFDDNGIIDSSGFTSKGKKNKTWYYYSDSLTVWQSEEYNNGILIKRMSGAELRSRSKNPGDTNDTSEFDQVEKEATFRGDIKAWVKYLEKNLQFPDRAKQLDKQGKVMINFVVDADGSVGDITLAQSVEFSLDEEALRLIRQSPKWAPAIQKGKPVKAYRRQPVTFAFR